MQEVFRGEYNTQAHLQLWSACLPLPDGRRACPQAGEDRQASGQVHPIVIHFSSYIF